jgi:hypothetical protein
MQPPHTSGMSLKGLLAEITLYETVQDELYGVADNGAMTRSQADKNKRPPKSAIVNMTLCPSVAVGATKFATYGTHLPF